MAGGESQSSPSCLPHLVLPEESMWCLEAPGHLEVLGWEWSAVCGLKVVQMLPSQKQRQLPPSIYTHVFPHTPGKSGPCSAW